LLDKLYPPHIIERVNTIATKPLLWVSGRVVDKLLENIDDDDRVSRPAEEVHPNVTTLVIEKRDLESREQTNEFLRGQGLDPNMVFKSQRFRRKLREGLLLDKEPN
jgi:hypothetical protein